MPRPATRSDLASALDSLLLASYGAINAPDVPRYRQAFDAAADHARRVLATMGANPQKRGSAAENRRKKLAQRLGDAFAARLKADLHPAQFAELGRRNATAEYAGDGACASRRFLDADTTMAYAFADKFGRKPEGDGDSSLIRAAWIHAKAAHLTAGKG